jgi:hypothetical protein
MPRTPTFLGLFALTATLAACGQTPLTAPSQGAGMQRQSRPVTSITTVTAAFDFVSPCNGELVSGTSTSVVEERVVFDRSGGVHVRIRVDISSALTGQVTGMTYVESSRAQEHVNVPSSGAVSHVSVLNGTVTASDGSTIAITDRFAFIRDANGVVRVQRIPTEATGLSCR